MKVDTAGSGQLEPPRLVLKVGGTPYCERYLKLEQPSINLFPDMLDFNNVKISKEKENLSPLEVFANTR